MDTVTIPLRAQEDQAQRLMTTIRKRVGQQAFNAWFKHGTRLSVDQQNVTLTVPNPFVANWIETHYRQHIAEAAETFPEAGQRILITIDPSLSSDLCRGLRDVQAEAVTKASRRRGRFPLNRPVRLTHKLEDFVVGDCNKLAYSAAMAVAGTGTSPFKALFVHGGCGLGKTHLLQGVCNAFARTSVQGSPRRWQYVTAEQFTNEFVSALRRKKVDAFRNRYRQTDLLAIDDVHFLSAKKATQAEFLHTFNALEITGGKIVMASDAHPRQVAELSQQLTSRFVAGMVVGIQPPDRDTRIRILRRQAGRMRIRVPEEVLRYIAAHIRGSIRELEGTLVKLAALSSLDGGEISVQLAGQALADHLAKTESALTLGEIEDVVAAYFGITPADLHSSRRTRTVSTARMVTMFLARRHTQMSYPEIGRFMGKNHSSVVLAVQRLDKVLADDGSVTWMTPMGARSMPAKQLLALLSEQIA